MGKKIIVRGADFSLNGFLADNYVQLTMNSESTNPYKIYYLPTALSSPIDTFPSMPNDAIEKSFTNSGQLDINEQYASLYCGRLNGESIYRRIEKIEIAYSRSIMSDINQAFRGIVANTLDLSGLVLSEGVNCNRLFYNSDIKELIMPNIIVGNATKMFYNLNSINHNPVDFSFIKKVTGSMADMFHYLKAIRATFNGIDVSAVTNYNDCFRYCELDDIDLSEWKPTAGVNFGDTFNGCLARTIHLDNWNISIAGWASSGMFANTNNLTRVFVTNCTTTVKNNLIGILNTSNAGGSSNWAESSEGGKAVLVPGA